jgi:hypothetical protein
MVMFKAKFKPMVAAQPQPQLQQSEKPRAAARPQLQQQQQQQPRRQQQQQPQPKVPPIEEERGPQAPVREPEPRHEPERVR